MWSISATSDFNLGDHYIFKFKPIILHVLCSKYWNKLIIISIKYQYVLWACYFILYCLYSSTTNKFAPSILFWWNGHCALLRTSKNYPPRWVTDWYLIDVSICDNWTIIWTHIWLIQPHHQLWYWMTFKWQAQGHSYFKSLETSRLEYMLLLNTNRKTRGISMLLILIVTDIEKAMSVSFISNTHGRRELWHTFPLMTMKKSHWEFSGAIRIDVKWHWQVKIIVTGSLNSYFRQG